MKKRKKSIVAILLCFSLMAFVGCEDNSAKVIKATTQNAKAESNESFTEVNWDVNISNIDRADSVMVKRYLKFINDANMMIAQEHSWDKEGMKGQAFVEVSLNTAIKDLKTRMWVDADIKGEDQSAKYILQVPEISKDKLPEEYRSKDYAVVDLYNYIKEEGSDEDHLQEVEYENLIETVKAMDPLSSEMLIDFFLDYDYEGVEVEYIGEEILNGVTVDVYKTEMSGEELEAMIRYTLDYLKNKSGADIENEVKLIEAIEKIEKTHILGEEGIELQFKINKEGFMVNQSGNIHLVLNLEEYINLLPEELEKITRKKLEGLSEEALVDVKLVFNNKNSEFNSISEVVIPDLNELNLFNFSDLKE